MLSYLRAGGKFLILIRNESVANRQRQEVTFAEAKVLINSFLFEIERSFTEN